MTNNKILNLLKVAAAFLLLSGTWAMPIAANGDEELGISIGVHAGRQSFDVDVLCAKLQEEGSQTSHECYTAAWMGGMHIRFRIGEQHALVVTGRTSGEHEFKFTGRGGERTTPFSVTTGTAVYEYTLGKSGSEGFFIRAGYHISDWEITNSVGRGAGDFSGAVLGAGFKYSENFILGYEYFDGGDDLDGGQVFYVGAELPL